MSQVPEGTWLTRAVDVRYDSAWVRLEIDDVVMPDGTQVDHHVVRMPRPAAGTVLIADGAVLLLYRHRFITDTWGWEIPAGGVDAGESVADAAIREAVEPLCTFHPANGILDQTFHIFTATDPVHRGAPTDRNEATRIEWIDVDEVRAMLRSGRISDGLSFGGLSYAFATGALG